MSSADLYAVRNADGAVDAANPLETRAAPVAAQDPILDHANGVKVTVTASAEVFTPPAGCFFARFSTDVDTFVRTDDTAAADDSDAYHLLALQPEILPVTPGVDVRAYCATSAVLRIIPYKARP